MDYMKLIVAQMQNLNPMDPSSGSDSMPLMMQAEELNQLTTLNKAITQLQTLTQTSYAAQLVGRTVTGVNATNATVTGIVKALHADPSGPILELSDGSQIRLLDVSDVAAS
jgi:flagellar basal-body rod modification protein FlgD